MGFQQSINAGLAAVGTVSKITEGVKAQKEATEIAKAQEALTLQEKIPELKEQEQSLTEELEAKHIESDRVKKKYEPEVATLEKALTDKRLSAKTRSEIDTRVEDIGIELRKASEAMQIASDKVTAKRKLREAYEARLNEIKGGRK